MSVGIDESGSDDQTLSINDLGGRFPGQLPYLDDGVSHDADVASKPGISGTINVPFVLMRMSKSSPALTQPNEIKMRIKLRSGMVPLVARNCTDGNVARQE